MAKLRILISGAGIAGNALAFWLSKLDHDITVLEKFPSLRTSGLQLDLRGFGVEVMKRMELEEAIKPKLVPEQGVQIVDKNNKVRGFFPSTVTNKGNSNFTAQYEIMRHDLCEVMVDPTKNHAKYVFGKSIESFEQTEACVKVKFDDGSIEEYDLLVGADGQGSRTRRLMLGKNAYDGFKPLNGFYIAYYTIPRPAKEGEEYMAISYQATRRRNIIIRRHNTTDLQVYLAFVSQSEKLLAAHRKSAEEEKHVLMELFEDAGWQTKELLEPMKDSDNFYLERLGMVKLDRWSDGRVVLLGDAAYCPSPLSGMGTTSAMVGAYILAGEISKHCGTSKSDDKEGLQAALKAYEETFRPFITQIQSKISDNEGNAMPETPFGVSMMNFAVGVVSFFKLSAVGEYFSKEKVRNWKLPDYEELLKKVAS